MYKNIIFDFDGTLNDSRDFTIATFVGIMKERIKRNFNHYLSKDKREILQEVRTLTFRTLKERFKLNLITFLKTNIRIQELEYQFLVNNSKETVLKELPFYNGMIELTEELKKQGRNIYILSSNKAKVIKYMLKLIGKEDLFIDINGETSLFGKEMKLRTFMSKHKMKKEDTIYIGDESRDAYASKKVGISIASVTWGYANTKVLQLEKPTYICESVKELRKILL
ncbi:MAG: Haloacid dehalogenase superfamily enzyme, subfamily IA [candidate division WS6 bacterium GW2011_GWF2_39_15]|uniref:Haloacid dehalogenase superfamily enzyme, subfamily IA n=1 Tax=candidate division WS6 bacterium GW2011_GWF2_39_15 TaxID=1619100 RepID=A0A0G0MZX3_9BACT|nr:MAG: Haloacid dehalogenase superfamily enzyme, subfamily IA [candidate division WS6 bacterium GW2011_GWF2_39_15]